MEVTPIQDHLVKVTLTGRLDTPGVARVETRFLASLVPGGNSAIVDVSNVEFITSMGIRMLVSAARGLKMRHATLALYGAPEQVRDVLDVGALGRMIVICQTEADALKAVEQ
jgi:anti-sigma B factor antagonist